MDLYKTSCNLRNFNIKQEKKALDEILDVDSNHFLWIFLLASEKLLGDEKCPERKELLPSHSAGSGKEHW